MGKASLTLRHFLTKLHCPVCGNTSDLVADVGEVNCGNCLMERLEFVRLIPVEATDCDGPDPSNVVLFRRPQS
jgi:hypothetical protein